MFSFPSLTVALNSDRFVEPAGGSHCGSAHASQKNSQKNSRTSTPGRRGTDNPLREGEVLPPAPLPADQNDAQSPQAQPHADAQTPAGKKSDRTRTGSAGANTPAATTTTPAKAERLSLGEVDTVVFALPRAQSTRDAVAQLRKIQTRRAHVVAGSVSAEDTHSARTSPSLSARGKGKSSSTGRLDELDHRRASLSPVTRRTTGSVPATDPITDAPPSLLAAQQPKGDLPATLQEFHTSPHYVVSLHAARQSVFDDALSGFDSYVAREKEELNAYWELQARRKAAQRPVSYDRTMSFEGGSVHVAATPVYKDPLEELQANMKEGEVLPASALFLMRSHDAEALHERVEINVVKREAASAAASVGAAEDDENDGELETAAAQHQGHAKKNETDEKDEKDEKDEESSEHKARRSGLSAADDAKLAELCQAEVDLRTRIQERLYERRCVPLVFRRRAPPHASEGVDAATTTTTAVTKDHADGAADKKPKKKAGVGDRKLSSSDLASLAVLDHPPPGAASAGAARSSAKTASPSSDAALGPAWPHVYAQFQRDLPREVLLVNGSHYRTPEDAIAAIMSFLDDCYDRGLAKVKRHAAAAEARKKSMRAKRGFFENLLETVSTFADDVARAAVGIPAETHAQSKVYVADRDRRGAQVFEATRQAVLAAQQSFMGFPYQLLCEQVGTERIALALEELEQEMDAWMTAEALAGEEDDVSASLQSSLMESATHRAVTTLLPPGGATSPSAFETTPIGSLHTPKHARSASGGLAGHLAPLPLPSLTVVPTAPAALGPLDLPAVRRRHQCTVPTEPNAHAPTQLVSGCRSPHSPLTTKSTTAGAPSHNSSAFAHVTSPTRVLGNSSGASANRLVRLYRNVSFAEDWSNCEGSPKSHPDTDKDDGEEEDKDKWGQRAVARATSSRSSSVSSSHSHRAQSTGVDTKEIGAVLDGDAPAEKENGALSTLVESATAETAPCVIHTETSEREARRLHLEAKRRKEREERVQAKREEQIARMPLIVGEPQVAEYEKLLDKIRHAVRVRNATDRAIKAKREAAKKAKVDKAAAATGKPHTTDAAGSRHEDVSTSTPIDPDADPVSWFREDVDGSALLLPLDDICPPSSPLSHLAATTSSVAGRSADRAMRTYIYFNEKRNIPMVCVDKVFRLFVMPGLETDGGMKGTGTADADAPSSSSSSLANKSLLLLIQVQFSLFDSEDVEIRWRWWTV